MDNIIITISGQSKTGKSIVARFIEKALINNNVTSIQVVDTDGSSNPYVEKIKSNAENLVGKLNPAINIVTKTTHISSYDV